jgi:citrate/tricarballylate utilization protein
MARLRGKTYQDYAWPPALGRLYQRNGLTLALALCFGLALFLWLASSQHVAPGNTFYDVFEHGFLVNVFAPVFLLALLAIGMGLRRFMQDITPVTGRNAPDLAARTQAARDALSLRYLDGGHGDGCHNEDDAYTLSRRRAHHATFYGFMLCFAATSVATLEHYLFGITAPYDLPALPKLFGLTGGVLLAYGAARLLWLNWRRHPMHGDAQQRPMDRAFLALLLIISISGLGLWLARTNAHMPLWLCVHLGAVMALFLTLPYGKMVHGFYRSAALLRYAVEKRLPNPIGLGND